MALEMAFTFDCLSSWDVHDFATETILMIVVSTWHLDSTLLEGISFLISTQKPQKCKDRCHYVLEFLFKDCDNKIFKQENIPVGCILPAFVFRGAGLVPGVQSYPPSPLDRMTDACENITFPQLRWREVINKEHGFRFLSRNQL